MPRFRSGVEHPGRLRWSNREIARIFSGEWSEAAVSSHLKPIHESSLNWLIRGTQFQNKRLAKPRIVGPMAKVSIAPTSWSILHVTDNHRIRINDVDAQRLLYYSGYWRRHFDPGGEEYVFRFACDSVSQNAFNEFIDLILHPGSSRSIMRDSFWEIGELIAIYEVSPLEEEWHSYILDVLARTNEMELRKVLCHWSVDGFLTILRAEIQKRRDFKLPVDIVQNIIAVLINGIKDNDGIGHLFNYGVLDLLRYVDKEAMARNKEWFDDNLRRLQLDLTVDSIG
jgi:hypothetical protein